MFIQKLAILVTTLYSFLIVHGVKDVQLSMQEEEIALDKEFQQLQKPSIKTIQDTFGDTYDCVNFYLQPAFDHPLLKNHTFHPEMRPTSAPKNEINSCDKKVIDHMKLKDGGCPTGTVPIKRISKNDFKNIKKFTTQYAKYSTRGQTPGTHVAVLRTNSDPRTTKYYGVGGYLNLYNLSLDPSEYSSGQFIIQNGDDKIKVGWTINPLLNKDNMSHLFQYLDAGKSHCFNTLCPGFVQTSKVIPVNARIYHASVRGGTQSYITILIFQDVKTGHWWLQAGGENIGFWPKEIFSRMSSSASYISVGGEVYGPPDRPLPPMGNGYYPVDDHFQNSYCTHLVVIDENQRQINPEYTETYSDDWHYGIYDEGISEKYGREIHYGGTTLW